MLSDIPGSLLVAELERALLGLDSEFIFTPPAHYTGVDLTLVLQHQ